MCLNREDTDEAPGDGLSHPAQTHMDGKKQQVDEAFRRLRQELADHQCLLQARLRKLEQQIRVEGEAYTSTLSEEIAGLGAQVQALGEQLQRPVSALLQVGLSPPPRGLREGLQRKGPRGGAGRTDRQTRSCGEGLSVPGSLQTDMETQEGWAPCAPTVVVSRALRSQGRGFEGRLSQLHDHGEPREPLNAGIGIAPPSAARAKAVRHNPHRMLRTVPGSHRELSKRCLPWLSSRYPISPRVWWVSQARTLFSTLSQALEAEHSRDKAETMKAAQMT